MQKSVHRTSLPYAYHNVWLNGQRWVWVTQTLGQISNTDPRNHSLRVSRTFQCFERWPTYCPATTIHSRSIRVSFLQNQIKWTKLMMVRNGIRSPTWLKGHLVNLVILSFCKTSQFFLRLRYCELKFGDENRAHLVCLNICSSRLCSTCYKWRSFNEALVEECKRSVHNF